MVLNTRGRAVTVKNIRTTFIEALDDIALPAESPIKTTKINIVATRLSWLNGIKIVDAKIIPVKNDKTAKIFSYFFKSFRLIGSIEFLRLICISNITLKIKIIKNGIDHKIRCLNASKSSNASINEK